jgi:hypothetical protein
MGYERKVTACWAHAEQKFEESLLRGSTQQAFFMLKVEIEPYSDM